jgi:predicted O-linked N-acetylglucosamine transferase (SPINDLY family)
VANRHIDIIYCSLGNTLARQGKFTEAIAAYRQAICIDPNVAIFHCGLGDALIEQGNLDEAIVAYRQALRIDPKAAITHGSLGNALVVQGKLDEAVAAYRQAISIEPNVAKIHLALGSALARQFKLDEAVAAYRYAIDLEPNYAEAHRRLANGLVLQTKLDEALAAYCKAIAINPNFSQAFSSLLFYLHHSDKITNDQLFAAHREWGERYGERVSVFTTHNVDRDPTRRLRIGYVSPDFLQHSVAYFVEPLLRGHDRQKVEIFCYSDVKRPDAVTTRLQGLAEHWLVTVGLSDQRLAERIWTDGIDILVDLTGHAASNRLLVFARRPAPVQVTWLGYPDTTGLKAIDYRLVDAVTDPVGEADAWASETLVRLEDGFLCYRGLKDGPEPAPPPCLKTGIVTFGSFNNVAKLSATTLDAWARLLRRIPQARLILKGRSFADASTRALFLARLGKRGVAADRIELVTWLPNVAEHLALYRQIDIALDPFPYNGTATTCEALWMGVPVVTLRGHRHAGQVGASLLTQIGLTDLIADSVDEYVEIAAALAGNSGRLDDLRRTLRPRMETAHDEVAFARKIERFMVRAVERDYAERR